MMQLNNLIRLGLPWILCVACQPSNLPVDGGSSTPSVRVDAVLLFGPAGFSDALRSVQSPITCNSGADEWQVKAADAQSLSHLAYSVSTNKSGPVTCTFRVEVPIQTTVDFNLFSNGIILFDNNYTDSLGALNLKVLVNNVPTVDYLGKKGTIQARIGGNFRTAGLFNGKLPLQFDMWYSSSNLLFQGDNWIVSNVAVYAAK